VSNISTPSPAEPRWRFIERTVAVLERMLAPGALVLHDQAIPEASTGIMRQCDVAVWYGVPPRQTLAAIAEVQDRGEKAGLQDFDAWCVKREKVGAQRLICVSREGFTSDVQKSAAAAGDIVSLMTLCEAGQRPPFLAATEIASHLQVLHYRDAKAMFRDAAPAGNFLVNAEIFEIPGNLKKVSLDSLASFALRRGYAKDIQRHQVDDVFHDLTYKVPFCAAGQPLLLNHEGRTYFVEEVFFSDRIEEVHQGLQSVPLAYEQTGINGALAWVLLGKGFYRGKEFYTQHSFRQLPNGRVQVGRSTMSKIEGMRNTEFFSEVVTSAPVPRQPTP